MNKQASPRRVAQRYAARGRPLWHITKNRNFKPDRDFRPVSAGGMDTARRPTLFATTSPTYWHKVSGGGMGPWTAGRRWAAELNILRGHPPIERESSLRPETVLDPNFVSVKRVIPIEHAIAEETGYLEGNWVGGNYVYKKNANTTPKDVHALADKLDISWDDDPGFMSWTKKVTGKEHLDDMSEKELRDVMSAMKSDPPKKTAKKLGSDYKTGAARGAEADPFEGDVLEVTKAFTATATVQKKIPKGTRLTVEGMHKGHNRNMMWVRDAKRNSFTVSEDRDLDKVVVVKSRRAKTKTAKKNYSLPDFQRAAKEADKAVTDAYLSAHSLKAMWDTFEEIPPKQRRIYDNNMKVISLLGKARDESYQDYMDLKRFR